MREAADLAAEVRWIGVVYLFETLNALGAGAATKIVFPLEFTSLLAGMGKLVLPSDGVSGAPGAV